MKIELEQLSKSFAGRQVLANLCAELTDGGITAVMGPSGCGKTTLLRILAGLEQPDGGRVCGVENARIGMTFQEDRLCPGASAVVNLQLVCQSSREELLRQLAAMGIDRAAAHQPASTLSGGQARRVALLRALLSPAQLLLLDEPFTGLDSETRELIFSRLEALRNGRTTVLVTHEQADAKRLGARVLRLAADAAPEDC